MRNKVDGLSALIEGDGMEELSEPLEPLSNLKVNPYVYLGNVMQSGNFFTDGHMLVRKDCVSAKKLRNLERPNKWRPNVVDPESAKKKFRARVAEATREGIELGFIRIPTPYSIMEEHIAIVRSGQLIITLNADYLRYMLSLVQYDNIKTTDDSEQAIVLYNGRKAVGLVMPILLPGFELGRYINAKPAGTRRRKAF